MKTLKQIIRHIPGFRTMSKNSIVIAATYYGAAILTMVRYWYWGLALLALPFVVFYLLDIRRRGGRKLAVSIVAGAAAFLLLGTACGLSAGGWMSGRSSSDPVLEATAVASPVETTALAVEPSAPPTQEAVTDQPSVVPTVSPPPSPAAATPSATLETATPAPTAVLAPVKLTDKEYKYFASKNSKTFHTRDCSSAKRIKPENLIGFKTREEAIAAGYQPCKRCKP